MGSSNILPKPHLISADKHKNDLHSLESNGTHPSKRTTSSGKDPQNAALELFQEELKNSIAQRKGQKIWKKVTCPEHDKNDCFYIHAKSKPAEVAHWLQLKGFGERAIKVLKPMTAEMLFNLRKDQLEKYLEEEGAKLHSFLLIQKNMSGYKTYTAKELNQILEERRQKADVV